MSRRALVAMAVLALTLPAGARAAPRSAAAAACSLVTAQTVSLHDMLAQPDRFAGRCVRVAGTVGNQAIFDDIAALYAYMTRRAPGPGPNYVALYAHDTPWRDRLSSMRANMEVAGIASTCRIMQKDADRESDRINAKAKEAGGESGVTSILVTGRCLDAGGPTIRVQDARPTGGAARLTGEAARARYGDAFVLRSPRESARAPVETLIEALRRGDRARLANGIWDRWHHLSADELLDPARSPYAFLFGSTRDPQVTYFDLRARLKDLQPFTVGVACICRGADCSKDWPIAFGDMNAYEGSPVKCVSVNRDGEIAEEFGAP